jgi:hypothetical protein
MNRNRAAFRYLGLPDIVGTFAALKPFLDAEASVFLIGCSVILFPCFCRIISRDAIGVMPFASGSAFSL